MISNLCEGTLTVPGRKKNSVLQMSDITHLVADSNYTFIHHVKKRFLSSKTLRHYQSLLCPDTFIRTHQSYCINIRYIRKIDFTNDVIILNDGVQVPISRSRKRQLKDFFKRRTL